MLMVVIQLVTTVTTLLASDSIGINATTCDPAQAGTSTITLMNANGCDSLITTVTILADYDSIGINATTCDPAQAGTNTITLMNANGCDSLVTTGNYTSC